MPVRTEKRIGCYTLRKIRKEERVMDKVYRIIKQTSKRHERVFMESRDKDLIKGEFKKLANKPNMVVRVRNWWIEHKVTGVYYLIEVERV